MDKIGTSYHSNLSNGEENRIRGALYSLNRTLSKTYQCRIFYRSRENLQFEAPVLLDKLNLLYHSSAEMAYPYSCLNGDLVIPYFQNREDTEPEELPGGYFVVINGEQTNRREQLIQLVYGIAYEIVSLQNRFEAIKQKETNYQVNNSMDSSNLILFRPTTARPAGRKNALPVKNPTDETLSVLMLPCKYPLIILAPNRELILRTALIAHDLLGSDCFIQFQALKKDQVLKPEEWVRLENHTLFCENLTSLDKDTVSKIQELTAEYRAPNHPLWIGGLSVATTAPVLLKEYSMIFERIFEITTTDRSSAELKEDLENFLLLR